MSDDLTATIADALAMSYGSHIHASKGGRDWKAAEDLMPVIDAEIRKARAEAWDEGQKSGLRYAQRAIRAHDMGRPDLPGPPSPNPYRDQIEGDQ